MNKNELINELKKCKNKEEVKELLKNNDIDIKEEIIDNYFNDSSLSDLELSNVDGGCNSIADALARTYNSGDSPKFYLNQKVTNSGSFGIIVKVYPIKVSYNDGAYKGDMFKYDVKDSFNRILYNVAECYLREYTE